jgi:hypothetical protein
MSGVADFNVEDFEHRNAADKNVFVKFYIRPFQDEAKSAEEGRPIYKDKEYVEIRTPGNQTNIIQRPVTDMDKQRFRQAYAAFKAGDSEQIIGTPLVETPWISRSQVEELAYLRIRTLEQLANVGDDVCTRIPGLFKLKQRAQAAIERAEKTAPFIAMQAENEAMRNRLEAMETTIAEQAAIIKRLDKDGAAKVERKG